jgi:hypothetical protein
MYEHFYLIFSLSFLVNCILQPSYFIPLVLPPSYPFLITISSLLLLLTPLLLTSLNSYSIITQASSCQVPQSFETCSGTHGPVLWVRDSRLILCFHVFVCFRLISSLFLSINLFICLPFLSYSFLSFVCLSISLIFPLSLLDFLYYRLAGTGHLAPQCRRYNMIPCLLFLKTSNYFALLCSSNIYVFLFSILHFLICNIRNSSLAPHSFSFSNCIITSNVQEATLMR